MSDEGLATEEYLEAEKQKLRKDIDALERITFGGPIQFIDRLQKTWDWIAERSFRWPRVPVLLWRLGMLGICTTFFTALFLVTVATILEIVLTQAQSGGINLLASLAVAHIISEATAKLFCLVSCAGLCLTFTGDYFPFGAAHEEAKIYALQKYLSNLRGHGPNHTKAPAEDRSDRFAKQAQDDTTALRRVLRAAVISVIFVGGFVSFWDTSDYSLALPEDTAKQVSNHAVFAVEWALNWLPLWVATVTLVATIITVLIICAVRLVTFIPAVACGNQNFTGQDHRTVRLLQYLFTPAPQHVVKEIRTIMQIHSGFTLMLVLVAIAVVKAMRLENMAVFPSCEWLVFRNTAVIASVLGLIACYIDFLLRNFRRARDAAKAAWRFVWCCGRKSPLTPAPASASASPQGASAPSEGSLATTQIAATPAEESPRDTQGAAASGEESLPAARPTTTELAADAKPAALPQSNITPGTPRESWACSSLVNLFWSSGTNGVMTTAGAIYLLALLVGVGTLPISHSSKALCMGLAVMIGLSSFYPTPRDGLCSFVWRVLVLVVSMAFFALSLAYGSAGENQSKWTPVIGNWATTPATVAYPVCGLTVNSLTIAEHCLMTAAAYSDAGNASHAFNTWFPNGISANHPLGGWHLEDLTLGGSAPRYIHMKNNLTNSSAVFIRGTSTMDDWLHDANLWLEPAVLQLSSQLSPTAIFSTRVMHRAVNLVDVFVSAITRSGAGLPVVVSKTIDLIGQVKSSDGGGRVSVSGHSLGGGLASIGAGWYGLESVSFSGPGWLLSSAKLGMSLPNATARSRRETVIIPDSDVVPRVDTHQGNVQFIQCRAGLDPGACHGLVRTCCELLHVCGDPLGRSLSTCDDGGL